MTIAAAAALAVLTMLAWSGEARADAPKQGAATAQLLAKESKPSPKTHAPTANAKPKAHPHPKAKAKAKAKAKPHAKPAKAPAAKPAKPGSTARA